jgi:hypothetical protein
MALLKYFLPFFFIIIALGEILKVRLVSAVTIGTIDFAVAFLLLIWVIGFKKEKYFLRKALILFVVAAIFSLLININNYSSNQLVVSALYILRFIVYASMYFVFVDLGKKYKTLIPRCMFLVGFIVLVIGFLQYLFFPSLQDLHYLGWDKHMYRMFSTFLDPNFAGAFFVLIFIFAFILRDKIFPQRYTKFVYIFLIFNFIAIILTYSRGALLMLLVSVITYSALTKNWKLTAGMFVSFVIIFLVLSPKFHFEGTNLLRFASVEARIESSKTALNIWSDNPMGVGFNAYRYAREKYGEKDNSRFFPSHAGAGVDNSFIFVLVTSGVLGFGAYIYLLYKMLRLGIDNIKKNKFALVLVVSLIGLMANAMFINSLFYSFIVLWIFILAGFTESSLRE